MGCADAHVIGDAIAGQWHPSRVLIRSRGDCPIIQAGRRAVFNAITMDGRPAVLHRAADLTTNAREAAEITARQVKAVYCTCAGAASPAVSQTIGDRLGVPVTVVPRPGMAAVPDAVDARGHNSYDAVAAPAQRCRGAAGAARRDGGGAGCGVVGVAGTLPAQRRRQQRDARGPH
jgi:hypothetical protein